MAYCGPSTQSNNFSHMYDQVDLRGEFPKKVGTKNSLSDIVYSTPEFSIFAKVLKKSGLEGFLDQNETNITLFVPHNNGIDDIEKKCIDNIDISYAKNIIAAYSLENFITSDILKDSIAVYFSTRDSSNRLFIKNINNETYITTLNNKISNKIIKFDIQCTNGIIHVIDGMYPIITN